MKLFHFTSPAHLNGIYRHGLTVGDVPTCLERHTGKIGVWLTTKSDPEGHGLEGSSVNKKAVRLTVEVPDGPPLWKWNEWAEGRVSASTRRRLEQGRGDEARTWYVFFGWIKPEAITEAVLTQTGEPIANWGDCFPAEHSLPGVPYWRREAWQKQMLKKVRQAANAL
jgi:hypothetical protein